jgi:hypothetical protein
MVHIRRSDCYASIGSHRRLARYESFRRWINHHRELTLRGLIFIEIELTAAANTVIAFYTEDLAARVGSGFKNPSLEVLGTRWFQASSKINDLLVVQEV